MKKEQSNKKKRRWNILRKQTVMIKNENAERKKNKNKSTI